MVAPSKLGIRQIWVDKAYRRHGVATLMLDNIRRYHTFGHNYDLSSLAFSQPTLDGKNFAFSYASNTRSKASTITTTTTAFPSTNSTILNHYENKANRGDENRESFIYVYA